MNNNDMAWLWGCNEFSEGVLNEEKLAIRFRNSEDANLFKTQFEAAQEFNVKSRKGEDLTMAETVENIIEETDHHNENVTAEESKS